MDGENDRNEERWQDWTPCEWSGHRFEDGRCRDCGEPQED